MAENAGALKGLPFHLADYVDYAEGSIVSKILLKKDIGNITLFSFDAGQGLSEHTAPFDAVVQILDGRAQITIGSETHEVRGGEMIIISPALRIIRPFSQARALTLTAVGNGSSVAANSRAPNNP